MRFNVIPALLVIEAALIGSLFGATALAAAIVLGLIIVLSLVIEYRS